MERHAWLRQDQQQLRALRLGPGAPLIQGPIARLATEEHIERRNAYFKKQAELEGAESDYQQKLARFYKILEDERGLKGIHIVTCSLVWNDGYPLGGASRISRFFNDTPYPALWFTPAGNQRGQAWIGLFHDVDGNGVMEFSPPGTALPSQRWTPELNFLDV